ncbi:MAG: hypothetical protein H6Q33_3882 [Deltaproteobacteria bacterium]|jgi:hypothetical protein|nr:hypothetical protein [Deltaproteobacteria bacterium]
MAGPRSPLKGKPLRNPGQSLDEEIQRVIDYQAMAPYAAIVVLWAIAVIEWFAVWRDLPRRPWVFTVAALVGTAWLAVRLVRLRQKVRALRLGRDGERAVGQFLEGLREGGARIFHDVPAEGFNLDHVVISTHGIYVVETKTITKPTPDAKVIYDGEQVTVAGFKPDRDPVMQASAEATWLRRLLQQSTGRDFPVRGAVVYPRWWVEQVNKDRPRRVWVLEPKALPKYIENEPTVMAAEDVALASYHLSRYVRGENGQGR